MPPADKQLLFVRKLHLCAFTFDFTNPTAHVREKEIKRQTLLELVDYVNSGTGKFTEQVRGGAGSAAVWGAGPQEALGGGAGAGRAARGAAQGEGGEGAAAGAGC